MTLNRTRVPMDFVVSRASRLYPAILDGNRAYGVITHLLGLPGKEASWQTAVLNVAMFQGLFRVPPVDGVYWTLQVELLFYALALILFMTRQMHRVFPAIWLLLLLRLIYWALAEFAHVDLPWRIREVLILDYIAFFALGIIAYRLVENRDEPNHGEMATAAFAIVVLSVTESIVLAGVGLACFVAVWLAALGRLGFLRVRLLVWFGSISYPLYLLHENIGWAILRQLQFHGWTPSAGHRGNRRAGDRTRRDSFAIRRASGHGLDTRKSTGVDLVQSEQRRLATSESGGSDANYRFGGEPA